MTARAAVALAFTAAVAPAAPVRDTDPLMVGTRWTGTLTQAGLFPGGMAGPPAFRTDLTVTKRSGGDFEADLRERTDALDITYVVRGEVVRPAGGKGYAVTFRSVDAKDVRKTSPLLGIPYTGTAAGRSFKGAWRYQPPGGQPVEGTFTLELAR